MNHSYAKYAGAGLLLLLMLASGDAFAQIEFKWLSIGETESAYANIGAVREFEPAEGSELKYPAIELQAGNLYASGIMTGVRNFTDSGGRHWDYNVTGVGPRAGDLLHFPEEFTLKGRYVTNVTVDGAQSFLRFSPLDEDPDPALASERMVTSKFNNTVGLEFVQTAHAFSQEYHDNYHIIEYEITNTGNTDSDADIELPDNDLEGVYILFISRYSLYQGSAWTGSNGQAWGKFTMNDAVGDGHEDYGVDFMAQYSWFGYDTGNAEWNSIGGPLISHGATWAAADDTTGRLGSAQMAGRVYLHADTSPSNSANDPGQPSGTLVIGQDHGDLINDVGDAELMRRQYQNWMEGVNAVNGNKRMYPHHADVIQPDGDFAFGTNLVASLPGLYRPAYVSSEVDEGGFGFAEAFGPYDIPFGESIHLAYAQGVAGLSIEAKLAIGRQYKSNNAQGMPETTPIEWNGMSMAKNEWVMTTRDSLFRTFERAKANYESGMTIPDPPKPPASFSVTSQPDKIVLAWELFPGEPQPQEFEIWRGANRFTNSNAYIQLAVVDGSTNSYEDANAQRGIEYYYYIQAVSADVNSDGTGLTPTGIRLKSGRYHTQTYLPASLTRNPGSDIDNVVIVPNPISIAQPENLRWPSEFATRLAFLEIPGQCTISIYTQLGELVKRIEHTSGSGDEFWNLATDGNQVIVSGLYIAHIRDTETGAETIKKFTVIR